MIRKCCPSYQKQALKAYTFEMYDVISEVNKLALAPLVKEKSVYFNPMYLEVMEQSNPEIENKYTLIFKNNKPVGFACFQLLNTVFTAPGDNVKGFVPTIHKWSKKIIGRSPLDMQFKVLVCGNAFITGEHGVVIADGENKNEVLDVLAEAIIELSSLKKTEGVKINVVLFKDFASESLSVSNEIKEYGYTAFRADPNMVMEINPSWKTFEDYKKALKSKFRTKLNKVIKDSAKLDVIDVNDQFFEENIEKFKALYAQVEERASFHLGAIEMKTFVNLKREFKDDFVVKAYMCEGKMVGYLTAFAHFDTLDAHFIGLDYICNRELAVYQRILYDYVSLAIEKGLSRIKFGRTAGEIKSTVGARPVDLTLYVKHTNSFANLFTASVMKQVKPKEFPVRKAFKE